MCFRTFADDHIQFNRKSAPGVVERLAALETCDEYEMGDWRSLGENLKQADQDTGLDALTLTLPVRASNSKLYQLPDYGIFDDEHPVGVSAPLPVSTFYTPSSRWRRLSCSCQ